MIADILHKVAAMSDGGGGAYYPRPSLAGPERCIRQMTYAARGEDRTPLPGRALVVMDDSSWHEELTADLLRKSAFQVHSEQMPVTIPDSFPWRNGRSWTCHVCRQKVRPSDCHGHLDFIVTDILGNDALVEHKALSHFGFERIHAGRELPLDYLTQEAIYLRGVQRDNPSLDRGLLLVKNKNQGGYVEIDSNYSSATDTLHVWGSVDHLGERIEIGIEIPDVTVDAFDRFRVVDEHRAAGTLPPRQYPMDHWRCDYCPYAQTCWGAWPEEHAALAAPGRLGEDVGDLLRDYDIARAAESAAKKRKEALRLQIKGSLLEHGARSGEAGGRTVSWSVSTKESVDADALPADARRAATVTRPTERLTVKTKKE
jgi:hypothetical protein